MGLAGLSSLFAGFDRARSREFNAASYDTAASGLRFYRWLALLLAYGLLFTALRSLAVHWSTHGLFSLWFPAAGLRFAFLWWAGPRLAPAAALAEGLVSLALGTVQFGPQPLLTVLGVLGPCLMYGLTIYLVRARFGPRSNFVGHDPMPFATAAVLAPMAACLVALAWALPLAEATGTFNGHVLFTALLVFTLGDLLGVLLVAPPLLWLARWMTHRRPSVRLPRAGRAFEIIVLVALAWVLVWVLERAGYGAVLAPVLLATGWAGFRGGRTMAWIAILFSAVLLLPITGGGVSDVERIQLHLLLVCLSAGAYLAGSYADAQQKARRELERRDRLLFQAERLRTLRAMSVGVIHEASQPLSTISLEANGLVVAAAADRPDLQDIRQTAALIAGKAADLAEMVRRLRRFGETGGEERVRLSVATLVNDVLALVWPEAQRSGVIISNSAGPDVHLLGNEVELRQALLNLARNALAAVPQPGGTIWIGWSTKGRQVLISVENPLEPSRPRAAGMGVGLIIARTIARAHEGRIEVDHQASDRVRYTLQLPLNERPHV